MPSVFFTQLIMITNERKKANFALFAHRFVVSSTHLFELIFISFFCSSLSRRRRHIDPFCLIHIKQYRIASFHNVIPVIIIFPFYSEKVIYAQQSQPILKTKYCIHLKLAHARAHVEKFKTDEEKSKRQNRNAIIAFGIPFDG